MDLSCVALLVAWSLPAAVEPPPIVTKEAWGSQAAPIPDARKQVPVWITIHHAGELWKPGADPAEFVRRLQRWGQNRPKLEQPPRNTYWPDLPYHFLIAPDGRIFEGRAVDYEPETNTQYSVNGNIGIELMGDFEKQRPSVAQIKSCVALSAWLCQSYRIDSDHVRGHMDVAVGQTDCPGKDFYRYLQDGQFKQWLKTSLEGKEPAITAGDALPDGPIKPIGEP
ncbi:MAG: negative regulator of beta-lactamase expression [Cyanobacteria bacterium RYN_339]|nr:negative regulator of beta-lactamase expression [Cyanobacteria bacterium RYN_339]